MSTPLDQIVQFVSEHPDCTVTDIRNGTGLIDVWDVLCFADDPGFPIYSTAGGNPDRGQTWTFRSHPPKVASHS